MTAAKPSRGKVEPQKAAAWGVLCEDQSRALVYRTKAAAVQYAKSFNKSLRCRHRVVKLVSAVGAEWKWEDR